MNRNLYVGPHSTDADVRPAFLWLTLTLLLLACSAVSFMLVQVTMGEWLELKMDSARYRVMEFLPEPERPDFVPTPMLVIAEASAPTIDWTTAVAARVTETPEPSETPHPKPTAIAQAQPENQTQPSTSVHTQPENQTQPTTSVETVALKPIQPSVQLTGVIHEAQRFNNCGPTTLKMYLSFFGYKKDTQVQIANVLKPNKDDRNVGPDELTGYAREKGFRAITRVNGNLERLKLFLSNDLPVIIETGYDPPRAKQGWMGHYRLVTGYDERGITAQDSYNGPDQFVAWDEVETFWKHFNRTYILVYTDAQEPLVRAILGEDLDDATMYAKAAQRAQTEWNANPKDAYAAFNLGSSLVGLREYDAAAQAFDRARVLKLPWRMMWYQFGPYEAYLQTGRYEEVIALADATLNPTGDLEESYYYKGLALERLGRTDQARQAFQLALKYNSNYLAAQNALQDL